MDFKEHRESVLEAQQILNKNGGSTEIQWKTGRGMFDVKMLTIPNSSITPAERSVLEKCSNNVPETEKNRLFFLLRLYYNYFVNYETYCAQWKFYYPEKQVDETLETFTKNKGKWSISSGYHVYTDICVIPYTSALFIN